MTVQPTAARGLTAQAPSAQGLYDPVHEKDSCGVGLVAHLRGARSHQILADALDILVQLDHRGARAADASSGDGCGVLTQIPHALLVRVTRDLGIDLPAPGRYAVGMVFLPREAAHAAQARAIIEEEIRRESSGLRLLGWRKVPVRPEAAGTTAARSRPEHYQFFVAQAPASPPDQFVLQLYVLRRRIEKAVAATPARDPFAIPSLSSTTIVYKGMLLPEQLPAYYPDLTAPDFETAIAMVHSRFSTNTFPSWRLAHPFRYLCHNGEINTLRGNLNWTRAREARLARNAELEPALPAIALESGAMSDSACLDNMVDCLVATGRSLPHALMMLVPEPWNDTVPADPERRAFYEYHATKMEPWDGPAALVFTDGTIVGATLDRNGLRPCRYLVTRDGRIVLSSESGVLPIPAAQILEKGRLEPGKLFVVDTAQGRIIRDTELKQEIASRAPYGEWLERNRLRLDQLPPAAEPPAGLPAGLSDTEARRLQRAFGYTDEELRVVLAPMAGAGEEAVSSMGIDTPLAILSDRPQPLFSYFKQHFAQVTNPPIDPIREQLVMSLTTFLGPEESLLSETPEACRRIRLDQPILGASDLARISALSGVPTHTTLRSQTLRALFPAAERPGRPRNRLETALEILCVEAAQAVRDGVSLLILSDRGTDSEWAAIPSLLAVSSVHQRLIAEGLRSRVSLIVDSAEPRDTHHMACLLGFGANAIHPYLALHAVRHDLGADAAKAESQYIKALGKGLFKVFSKMGISTLQSYCGAQIFEAVGLGPTLISRHFSGTASRVAGMEMDGLQEETLRRHRLGFDPAIAAGTLPLESGGDIHYRKQGEAHLWNPETLTKLQQATRTGDARTFREFCELADEENRRASTLRGLLELKFVPKPVPLDEVEPATEIVKRFTSGAMSLGAISPESHETLAIAMNRIGAKSNTGEGGEDARRFEPLPGGDSANSAIKQVASARFGVTTHYLVNARELQIKMAQGAKPGEGGQLPGHKVDALIAGLRHSTPGVQLISPPPHHDIYSIEDLAQLIYDLGSVNPEAEVSVKLVSEAGVGTIAAGVAKAHADKILISGDSGGTGASPLSSIRHAGLPWELGLAETHQTLVLNDLRDRVRLETDGQLRTGRDVVIAALLGAQEFGFATAPLIVEGCLMMRKCHLNTCPVGIATQDPVLRARFAGKPEHLVNYFFFVAKAARSLMSRLGFRTIEEMVGRVDRLGVRALESHWKTRALDLSPLLHPVRPLTSPPIRHSRRVRVADPMTARLLEECRPAIDSGARVALELPVRNTDRAVGATLSGRIARKYGAAGLPKDTISLHFTGSAGQSFGAFACPGLTMTLEGEANDYVGKGLSGGKIAVFPPIDANYDPSESMIAGNTLLYGATAGELYLSGRAGERFAVRNSGATAVVEGVGDHGCEYMTGGTVVVLGRTGRNFAAGMSGGVAYVLDDDGSFRSRCNTGMVELTDLAALSAADPRGSAACEEEMRLQRLIQDHLLYTDSRKALRILQAWASYRTRFIQVMPIEYKKALAARAAESAPAPQTPSRITPGPRVVPQALTPAPDLGAPASPPALTSWPAARGDGGPYA